MRSVTGDRSKFGVGGRVPGTTNARELAAALSPLARILGESPTAKRCNGEADRLVFTTHLRTPPLSLDPLLLAPRTTIGVVARLELKLAPSRELIPLELLSPGVEEVLVKEKSMFVSISR